MDELKAKYKALSLGKRLAICFFLGLLPATYLYYDQAPSIEEELTAAETAEKDAARKLVDADKKLKNLEKTEGELAFTTDQLKKAETRLPDNVAIDEILRNIGKSAKDSGVTIAEFQPMSEMTRGDEYKYTEIPLKMTVEAHEYSQICSWLDTISGLKSKLYLKSWSLMRQAGTNQPGGRDAGGSPDATNEVERALEEAMRPRRDLVLKLSADFSVYRLAMAPTGGAAYTGSSATSGTSPSSPSNTNGASPPSNKTPTTINIEEQANSLRPR
jgi:Tfp pilus assembly protein PilO